MSEILIYKTEYPFGLRATRSNASNKYFSYIIFLAISKIPVLRQIYYNYVLF